MEDDYTQFNYFKPGDQASAMASEALLKEIGVDIKKFLSQPKESQPQKKPSPAPSQLMLPALPSLSQLGGPPTGTQSAQPTRILDMKFRAQQAQQPPLPPTDDQLESYQESHRKRLLLIEQRFLTSTPKDDQPLPQPALMTAPTQPSPPTCLFSAEEGGFFLKKRQPVVDHQDDGQVVDDLVMEDLMMEEEAKEEKEGAAGGVVLLVRKTSKEKEKEMKLVDRLLEGIRAGTTEEEDKDDDIFPEQIDSLLDGSSEKRFDRENRDPNMPHMRQWLLDLDADTISGKEVQDAQMFTQYMSWQTESLQHVEDSSTSKGQVSDFTPVISDPFSLESLQKVQLMEELRYNEHQIYSDHSEDEEAVEI